MDPNLSGKMDEIRWRNILHSVKLSEPVAMFQDNFDKVSEESMESAKSNTSPQTPPISKNTKVQVKSVDIVEDN